MQNPSTTLAYLIAAAAVVGAFLYGNKIAKTNTANSPAQAQTIASLSRQIDILKAENQTLKAIQSTGEITLPIELYTFVEKNVGLTFQPHIPVFTVEADRLQEAAEMRWISAFSSAGMDARNAAFEQLAILPPSQNYLGQLALAETVGAIGIYDVKSAELLLAERYDPENIFHQASVIRLLVIALLEQQFPAAPDLTDDQFFARDAVIRGRASMVAQRFQNIYASRFGHIKQFNDNADALETFNALPTLVRSITTFPTLYGKSYLETLAIEHDRIFPQIYSQLPRSTAQILRQPPTVPQPPVTPPPTIASPGAACSLGQLGIMAYIQRLELEQPAPLHLQLLSDSLTLPSETRKAAWQTHWKSEAAATAFLTLATDLSSTLPQPPKVIQNGKTITILK